jgi:hypothetical protein
MVTRSFPTALTRNCSLADHLETGWIGTPVSSPERDKETLDPQDRGDRRLDQPLEL